MKERGRHTRLCTKIVTNRRACLDSAPSLHTSQLVRKSSATSGYFTGAPGFSLLGRQQCGQ
ncbi:hypothetical protein V1478_008628 [Vespula squamosa]|uniref:Uncharacterized protein n=1 Tax=Vespula squamosa TaxID=30214 RepID=A0ABD2AWS1_VESSQ